MKKTLIVGVGSILRGDDAVGVRVIDAMQNEKLPEWVKLHSGDVSGLDLLKVFLGFEKVIIVDAADMKEAPGTIKVFTPEEIKKSGFEDKKFSTHGMALSETLALAEKLKIGCEITIVGVQPQNVSYSLEMSEAVKSKIPEAVQKILDRL